MNILNKLTIKHLTMNKKRTIVTIIGVLLSTALMVGIGLLLSTFREMMINEAIAGNGNYHASFSSMDSNKVDIIKNNGSVDYYYTKSIVGYGKVKEVSYDYKPYFKVITADSSYLKELKLKEGRFPKDENEVVIPSHILDLTGVEYKIGDTINIELGDRMLNNEITIQEYMEDTETFVLNGQKVSYRIVGIIERDKYENYSDPGFNIFTFNNNLTSNITAYIRYKNPNKTYDITENIAKTLNLNNKCTNGFVCYDEIGYNDSLVSLYGASKYNNIISSMGIVLAIMLSVVSLGCIIVIYNSFAISVMERKKQFGLFSSIGATKTQLRKTVFFEAIIVSLIGIPLGILSAYVGIGVVVLIMNNLLGAIYDGTFHLCTYTIFIAIPVLFMILTIFISAFIPARKASKITPIEAIRLNDDIKVKGKKIRTPKFIRKIFGVEGDIALKNIKRNKKKYRITIASLFISIVMFVSFSGFLTYSFSSTESYMSLPDYDFSISYNNEKTSSKTIDELRNNELVEKSIEFSNYYYTMSDNIEKMYTSKYRDFLKEKNGENTNAQIFVLSDKDFKDYLDQIGAKESKPVLFNKYEGISYTKDSRKSKTLTKYDKNKREELKIYYSLFDEEKYNSDRENYQPELKELMTISDYHISSEENLALKDMKASTEPILVMSETDFSKVTEINSSSMLLIKTNNVKSMDEKLDDLIDNNKLVDCNKYNIYEQMKMMKDLILMMKILIFGFIALVTLIGVTSVFNTINTSIALRRKEFAMLRSMGLTPKGFNKILYFESLFVGLKSLLYGLPFSFIIILLLHSSMSNMVQFEHILIPYKSILISIVGVFIIVLITMMYASSKIKHENILDAIREENI